MINQNEKYTAIIVIYNKCINESLTCKCIDQIKDLNIDILVVDNSTRDYGNKIICCEKGYRYLSMDGNKGLSKAYNLAIDNSKADVYLLFDDDTEITIDYFEKLHKAIVENEEVDIFAPIVYGQDGVIYSPNKYNFLKNHFIKSKNEIIDSEYFNAIASCLAIRNRVFDGYRFDETLFVDQVDQYFFYQQRQRHRKFMIIDTEINQNFYQRGAELTPINGWKRVKLRFVDIMRQAKLMGGIKYKLFGFIKCCGLALQISRKTKSVSVLIKGVFLSVSLLFFLPKTK